MYRQKPIQLSQVEKILNEVDLCDLRNKMKMAERVSCYVKMDIEVNEITHCFLGISEKNHTKLMEKVETIKSRDLKQLEPDLNSVPTDQNNFTYMDIRELLIEHYIEKQEIPTREILIVDLEHKSIPCNDNLDYCLKLQGFIWRKLLRTNKSILTEHPKRVAERHRYFKELKQHRDDDRPIYYIEENSYTLYKTWENKFKKTTTQMWHDIVIFTENTLIKKHSYIPKVGGDKNLHGWFKNELIPLLYRNSVVVIDEELVNKVDNDRLPNGVNSKEEIKQWLNSNNIPHEDTLCKAELMTLVNNFTKEKGTVLEGILKIHGHEMLRRPKDFPNLSVIATVKKYTEEPGDETAKESCEDEKVIPNVLEAITEEQWKQLFDGVKLEEKKILKEDLVLDGIIDKLMALTAQGGFDKSEDLDDYERDIDYYVLKKNASL